MQRLEISGAVRLIYKSLGVKGLKAEIKSYYIPTSNHHSFPISTL